MNTKRGKQREVVLGFKGKRIPVVVEDCNLFRKFSGLMFSRREKARNLFFSFRKKSRVAIHSFFVFYDFLALWIDERNEVIEIKKVKPFCSYVCNKKPAVGLLEIPISEKNREILEKIFPLLDGN